MDIFRQTSTLLSSFLMVLKCRIQDTCDQVCNASYLCCSFKDFFFFKPTFSICKITPLFGGDVRVKSINDFETFILKLQGPYKYRDVKKY